MLYNIQLEEQLLSKAIQISNVHMKFFFSKSTYVPFLMDLTKVVYQLPKDLFRRFNGPPKSVEFYPTYLKISKLLNTSIYTNMFHRYSNFSIDAIVVLFCC